MQRCDEGEGVCILYPFWICLFGSYTSIQAILYKRRSVASSQSLCPTACHRGSLRAHTVAHTKLIQHGTLLSIWWKMSRRRRWVGGYRIEDLDATVLKE